MVADGATEEADCVVDCSVAVMDGAEDLGVVLGVPTGPVPGTRVGKTRTVLVDYTEVCLVLTHPLSPKRCMSASCCHPNCYTTPPLDHR